MNASKPCSRRRILLVAPLLLVTIVALSVLAVTTVWAKWPTSNTFNPSATMNPASDQTGAVSDIDMTYDIPSGDAYDEYVVTYLPPEWGNADDDNVPDGTKIATLDSISIIGLALGGQTCNMKIPVHFDLLDSTTKGTCFKSVGTQNSCKWNGFDLTCPNSQPRFVCEYPCFLDDLLPSRPIARFAGRADVVKGSVCALLTFVAFAPGTNLGHGIPATESWGFPTLTILDETGAPVVPVPGSLVDTCTPLESTTKLIGKVGDIALRTNPACPGTYTFRSWSRGKADADNDGLENVFDPCPFVKNDGDPRVVNSGDADADGLDAACDPDDNQANLDQDADGYINRGDNCPLAANGVSLGPDNQADADADGIGDACDPHPNSVDGERIVKVIEDPVDIVGAACGTTGTATATATATTTGTATATGTAAATGTATAPTEGCGPVIPGTYNGLVRLNGVPAAAGYEVTANIDSTAWGSAIVSGGRYAMDVPAKMPTAPPCFSGGTITFKINGATCTPTETFASGLHNVDLACAPVPTATPTATVTTPTPVATTPAPTATKTATATATPVKPPPSGGGGLAGGQGLPLWAIALAGWASLMALAGVGTLATRIVKR